MSRVLVGGQGCLAVSWAHRKLLKSCPRVALFWTSSSSLILNPNQKGQCDPLNSVLAKCVAQDKPHFLGVPLESHISFYSISSKYLPILVFLFS